MIKLTIGLFPIWLNQNVVGSSINCDLISQLKVDSSTDLGLFNFVESEVGCSKAPAGEFSPGFFRRNLA